ncbi:MAG TPA: MFS transporter, partial [Casimicrobiaceae bacterium]|nr:MFS transporter [Casimicrobiaceae bacterium]
MPAASVGGPALSSASPQPASSAPASSAGEPAPLSGLTLALGTVALSLATFMNVLDTSIANVSLPAIAGDLGVSPDQGTWVITSFGVANA